MGERNLRMDPVEAEMFEIQRAEERRPGGHRMNGGPGIVDEAGKSQLRGTGGAAGRIHGLEDEDAQAGAGEEDGCGESIGP